VAAGLAVAAAALHVAYLAADPPLDLAPDEAHYWEWSRHLDWSYYSKGPLVAWLIRASCELFGPLSRALTGNDALAVRLPAVACGTLLLVSLYLLTVQALGRERTAAMVVALALAFPVVSAGATVMTIDAPYTACWGWALVLTHHAVFRRAAWAWPLAGAVAAVGILAKYTMVLWVPCVGLFLLTSAEHRRLLRGPGFWLGVGVAALGGLPILYWNARNDWVSFRHVGALAGLLDDDDVRWLGPLRFAGEQAALLLGFWFVAWVGAMVAFRPGRGATAGERFLWWTSAPVFGVFLALSLVSPCQINWAVTAYLSGSVLAVHWLSRWLAQATPVGRKLALAGAVGSAVVGLAVTLTMHAPSAVRPLLGTLAGPPTEAEPLPLRRLDPTCRLCGWRTLAAAVDADRAALRAAGDEPLVAGAPWGVPGELAFYCGGQPAAYTFGPAQGDRRCQYDLWRPNPFADPEAFRGRTFVFVGDLTPEVAAAFGRVGPTRKVYHVEGRHPVSVWKLTVCSDFRGFGLLPEPLREPHY
jgi:hypothetical protein